MNRTFRTTAAAVGVGALLAGGLAVTNAVAAPDDDGTTVGAAFGIGNAYGRADTDTTDPRGRAQGNRHGATIQNPSTASGTSQVATASPELAEALVFAREEERMARDLYAAIADLYDGARPFSMITNSEQRHFDAVGTLLARYGLDDPAQGAEAGVFENATIQALYDNWWAQAQVSLDAAYQVGIELEQRDIADLENMIAADHPSDVDAVFSTLLRGSQHHLAAYERAADGTLGIGDGPQGDQPRGRGAGMMNGGAGYDGDCPMDDEDA
jgi:hypothetical protein